MQGKAEKTTVHVADHQARGMMSPIGGGQPDPYIVHRAEDVASAPMTRTKDAPPNTKFGGPVSTRMAED